MSDTAKSTKRQFKADIVKLLDIITHSVYTNREIFLRELISNASDALEKLRFEQSRGTSVAGADLPLEISITTDKENNTLTITDTGIGMSELELVENIGSIAHSGSENFIKALGEDSSKASSIIGRFGVGFYSVFMAARQVVLTTRSATPDEPAWVWISDGLGGYELIAAEGEVPRGTSIEIHLKDDATEFADPDQIKDIINRHSHFISFPILVDGGRVNTVPAVWREPKSQVTAEQYKEFYSFLTHDTEAPIETVHMNVDAPVQFSALVFVPAKSEEFLGMSKLERGLDLYVRRVLIAKDATELLPEYLRFCRGVVDTEDLPLNLSRETLQENMVLRRIAQAVTKEILSRLRKKAASDPDGYAALWKEHAKIFKLGYSDFLNREAYAELLRFDSSAVEEGKLASLTDYVSRAREGQKTVYYISGPSREAVELSPHLEMLRRKGLEVLYLYEPIDEFMLESMGSFKEFGFKSAEQAQAKDLASFDDAAPSGPEAAPLSEGESKLLEGLLARMKEVLGDRIKDVRASERLKSSPSCLVSADGQMSSQMQRIMRMMSKDETIPDKIMEVNPDHPLTRNLLAIYGADHADAFIAQATEQLYESALLLEGYLSDPHKMVGRINAILEKASGWYAGLKAGGDSGTTH
ncbi:molecular chaperone HtpG [Fundidesulfovibrio terrae]|uniref:molecular chaperone HtpG n=1 Tax=Fundidesulfovibrio terrae TaxID=2922866 RepID=UPI001FAF5A7E|nr:molecular chaperone HtpG [Fundidesulfovibrio terrae]